MAARKPTQKPIPAELSVEVMFASDRTCCVCRKREMPVQIHHIDENHNNNSYDNLAVLCVVCHIDVHSKKAFSRNIAPNLVRRYNQDWQAYVKEHLAIGKSTGTLSEYTREVFQEISLACYEWAEDYIVLNNINPEELSTLFDNIARGYPSLNGVGDIWGFISVNFHIYEYNWDVFKPLFNESLASVIERLERILMVHSEVVSIEMKIAVLRTVRELKAMRVLHNNTPKILASSPDAYIQDPYNAAMRGIGKALSTLAAFAKERRDAISQEST